ncbi:Uncharacterised protein [Salmonella enterica subsp. enterica serovar Typhimurium str. DT104]|nr:Uncharacterised protein [Salmonella enterica subsp. enterica serovar Typhimurium str. DT104]
MRQAFFQRGQFRFGVFIAAFGFLLYAMDSALAGIEVSQRQFGIDNINIFCRVYFTRHMDDIVVLKAANHVTDSFSFTDIGQELVTQPFAFGRAFYQTGDIHELHRGW